MSNNIFDAIKKINPQAEFLIEGEDINSIQWVNGTTPISTADIQAQFSTVEFDRAIAEVRKKRNKLLAETDHLALSDQTLSAAMTTYRQNLRDITDGLTTKAEVDAVTFPTKPTE